MFLESFLLQEDLFDVEMLDKDDSESCLPNKIHIRVEAVLEVDALDKDESYRKSEPMLDNRKEAMLGHRIVNGSLTSSFLPFFQ
jgi:hypothetical protein